MIYFGAFFFSSLLFALSMKVKRKRLSALCIVGAVLVVAILSGCRDYTVGTDVKIYGLYTFEKVKDFTSIFDFITRYSDAFSIEPGYAFIAYLSSKISDDPHVFFFIVSFINNLLIGLAINNNKRIINPALSWLLFLLLYYSDTLNIMRQTLALAIVFYGLKFIDFESRSKTVARCCVVILIAFLFHYSALISIIMYAIFYWMRKRNVASRDELCKWLMIICIVTFVFPRLFSLLVNNGVLPSIYTRYLSADALTIAINPTIIRMAPIIVICIFWNGFKRVENAQFYMIMLMMDLVLYNLTTVTGTFERICLYFGYFRIYAYSTLTTQLVVKSKANRQILKLGLVLYASFIFIYQVIIRGGNQVYPYTSIILGI